MPTAQNVDVFVKRLVRAGLLIFDPLIDEIRHGERPRGMSERIAQLRFRRAVGISCRKVASIEQARRAAQLPVAGKSIAEVVTACCYYDHSQLVRAMRSAGGLVLGRVPYEGFAETWPTMTGDVANKINSLPKYVAPSTLTGTKWNAEVLSGDPVDAVRSLQEGFQRGYTMSPMAYVRAVRLERAHDELSASSSDEVTVSEVAARWGFPHASRFAVAYKRKYRCSPSQTLRTPPTPS
jgi:AraC-like DNA-binding protein